MPRAPGPTPRPATPTPHPELNDVLRELVAGARGVLGGRFVGAILIGSFAGGDHDAHSDVDFVVAVTEDPEEGPGGAERLAALQALHDRLHDGPAPWAQRLDGSYVPLAILRRPDPARTEMLYLDNGARRLMRSDHCNWLVIRWQVRERSVVLAGPPPASLVDPIDADALRREAAVMMRGWAAEIRAEPAQLDDAHAQPYAVLAYCRMLYTLREGALAPKAGAAAWAKGALEPRWHALIDRALRARARAGPPGSGRADPGDLEQTHAFIGHVASLAGSSELDREG